MCLMRSLNFSTVVTSEEDEYGYHDRRKMSRDPMSHRIIEKRRRDRMNNCLADLSRLIPADYLKKGRGRIEKTEIIEMAIKHMKYLHSVVCTRTPNANPSNELPLENSQMLDNYDQDSKVSGKEETSEHNPSKPTENSSSITELDPNKPEGEGSPAPINLEHFKLGYQECLSESMHYLVEVKGYDPMSHRIIEKRRRDRMNNCLADLSRLIPADYLKKGRGRIEKTEIIEMAIKHMKYLHSVVCTRTPNANPSNELPLENSQMLGNHFGFKPAEKSYMDQIDADLTEDQQVKLCTFQVIIEAKQEQCPTSDHRMIMRHPQQDENYPTETSPCPSTSADNHSYKFKNNIKQRFTAEHSIHQNGSSSGYFSVPPAKKSRSNETTSKYDDSPSNDSHCYESRCHDFPSDMNRYEGNRSVAIFALHGDGTFYIPLTVDYTSLIPYLGAFSLRRSSRNPPLVLHPVTLSVCFQQNGRGYTRHTSHTVSAASSDLGATPLVKVQK
ncbi:uncharacterized protein LOC103508840 [Diaphorina citri]|uniref:Hairy and enhancer of split-related protein HELT n=1 Tax=Diaphorina citri TaxID=121845 RepID=A0A3Q0IS78_DIACI|nr:uncharacterized protein LOC103508840 [Diaphorina citri]